MFLETDFAILDHFDVVFRPIFTEIGSGNLEGVGDNVPLTIGYRRYYLLENDSGFGENRGPFLMIWDRFFLILARLPFHAFRRS